MQRLNRSHVTFILILAAVALEISSCQGPQNDFVDSIGTVKVSIPISGESFGDDISTRSATRNDTIFTITDLGGGAMMETSIAPEYATFEQTRAANTIISGTVFVAVYDGNTLYRAISSATISNGVISNIEVPIGKPIKLVFYANYDDATQTCTAPAVSSETITNSDNASGTIDLMRGEISSVTIVDNTTTLDGFTFRHLYSRAKVTYMVNIGTIESKHLNAIIREESFCDSAKVALSDGTVTTSKTNVSRQMDFGNIKTNNTNSITSVYKYFIANESANSITLLSTSTGYINNDLSKNLNATKVLNGFFAMGKATI
jgi:hypothetical protein